MTQCRPGDKRCSSYLWWVSPVYFIAFVIMAQFVLVNLVVAVIMQATEDSKEVQLMHSPLLAFFLKMLCGVLLKELYNTHYWENVGFVFILLTLCNT